MDLDFYDRSIQYAQDVVEGKVVVGEYIKQACERFLLDLTKDDWRCTLIERRPTTSVLSSRAS